jgi:hypothetical protein
LSTQHIEIEYASRLPDFVHVIISNQLTKGFFEIKVPPKIKKKLKNEIQEYRPRNHRKKNKNKKNLRIQMQNTALALPNKDTHRKKKPSLNEKKESATEMFYQSQIASAMVHLMTFSVFNQYKIVRENRRN